MGTGPLDLWAAGTRQVLAGLGLERRVFDTPAGRQSAFLGGAGPSLVLLHGAGDQAGTWAAVVPGLLQHHALLIPDLAGHGDSEPASGPIEAAAIYAGLESVLERWAEGRRPTLVGNSLGAWMALVLALRRPDLAARVVAVNGGPLKHAGTVNLLPASREEARATMAATRDAAAPPIPDFILDDLVRLAKEGPLARFAATAERMDEWTLDEAELRRIAQPVHLLWGTADQLLPLAYAERLRAALADARLVPLERCGHVPQQEAPARLLAALQAILEVTGPAAGSPR